MKNRLLILIATLFLSGQAFAGILIDPYLGYRTGGYDFDVSGSGSSNGNWKYDASGVAYGARLGISEMGFMVGVVGELGSVEDEAGTTPVTALGKDEYDTKAVGIFVGYQLPVALRFWASYYFNYEWEASKSNTVTGTDKGDINSGKALAVGLGYTLLPLVSLNLEYRSYSFDEFKDGVTGVVTKLPTGVLSKIEGSEILFSISLPFKI